VKRVVFHPEAEADLLAAAQFYESHARSLGVDFIAEVRRAGRIIASHPRVGHRFSRRLRRLLVRQFPFGVVYREESDAIFIVAVAHLRRRPDYWRTRR